MGCLYLALLSVAQLRFFASSAVSLTCHVPQLLPKGCLYLAHLPVAQLLPIPAVFV
jgi:hypothetical protein